MWNFEKHDEDVRSLVRIASREGGVTVAYVCYEYGWSLSRVLAGLNVALNRRWVVHAGAGVYKRAEVIQVIVEDTNNDLL